MIRLYRSEESLGAPRLDYRPAGNSMAALAGDIMGLTTGGLLSRRATAGQITANGGVWGILVDDLTTDANGVASTPAAPSGVNPAVPAKLALTQRADSFSLAAAIAGVQRSQGRVYPALDGNVFIQRHKIGTRVNQSLIGKKCDFTWNTTTLEWEVDTTDTTVGMLTIVEIPPFYADNKTYYDSATYATDAKNAWVAFVIVPALQASLNGLRY